MSERPASTLTLPCFLPRGSRSFSAGLTLYSHARFTFGKLKVADDVEALLIVAERGFSEGTGSEVPHGNRRVGIRLLSHELRRDGGRLMDGSAMKRRLLAMRMAQVKKDTFPSVEMMNRIEAGLQTKEELEAYAEILMNKIESTQWPSLAMVNRFERVLERAGAAS
jgi:hypothetical protein